MGDEAPECLFDEVTFSNGVDERPASFVINVSIVLSGESTSTRSTD